MENTGLKPTNKDRQFYQMMKKGFEDLSTSVQELSKKVESSPVQKVTFDEAIKGEKGDVGAMPEHKWEGTQLQFQNPDKTWGALVNVVGPRVDHKWEGSALAFENPDGSWSKAVDLRGPEGPIGPMPSHKWSKTTLYFEMPDGNWDAGVDLRGAKGDVGPRGYKGDKGPQGNSITGPKGDMPDHEWDDTKLRFQKPDGSWGKWSDLKGDKGDMHPYKPTGSSFGMAGPSTSVLTFNQLTDVPSSYAGHANQFVAVNSTATGLEFVNGLSAASGQYRIYVTVGTSDADYITDGVDDQVEINQAIIYLNSIGGGALILKSLSYTVSNSILRLPNVHIWGQGMAITKVGCAATMTHSVFDMDKATYTAANPMYNSQINELEVDASGARRDTEMKCINGGNFNSCKLYRIYAHGSTATGIGDDDFYGTTISQCIVERCGYMNEHVITAAVWATNQFTFTTADAHGYSAWTKPTGTLTSTGAISNNDTVVISGLTYTFKTVLTGASFEVLIGGSAAAALANLKSAINLTGTIGTDYGLGTVINPKVGATTLTATTLVIEADTYGDTGNVYTTTTTGANISFGAATLTGGVDGSQIIITGMLPALYNGLFNVTSVVDSDTFIVQSANNSSILNFTIDPGAVTAYGSSSDSLIGHNGIGIAEGSQTAEACIVTDCVCINNQNNNFLIEADANYSGANVSYIFSNCISINAGRVGFRNTGALNAQFNNCFDYGSPIGGHAVGVSQIKTVTIASWTGGVATFEVSSAHGYSIGSKVSISSMIPTTYNGYYEIQSVPTTTSFTVNIANNPGTAMLLGTSTFEVHGVDGSSFNNPIFSNNLNYGLLVQSDGVMVKNPTIKNCYNYGAQLTSSYTQLEGVRIYNSGRQGVRIVNGTGIQKPITQVSLSGFVYNNGTRFASIDGVDLDPSDTAAIQNVSIDVHAFDDQVTKTQRYGVILRSGGTLANISVKGNLKDNATAPILVQNTSNSIYVSDVIGVNPNGRNDLGNITGSTTFDVGSANVFYATLIGNITAVMTVPAVLGSKMTWILTQDATGGRTLTLPVNAAAAGGILTLSKTAGAIDIIDWVYDGTKWREESRALSYRNGLKIVSTAVNYAVSNNDDIIKVTVSTKIITLHDATTAATKRYTIKNASNGNISFATTSSQTVDGSTTGTIIPNQSIDVVPDGANWIII